MKVVLSLGSEGRNCKGESFGLCDADGPITEIYLSFISQKMKLLGEVFMGHTRAVRSTEAWEDTALRLSAPLIRDASIYPIFLPTITPN